MSDNAYRDEGDRHQEQVEEVKHFILSRMMVAPKGSRDLQSTYGFKHTVERLCPMDYISEGAAIDAINELGVPLRKDGRVPYVMKPSIENRLIDLYDSVKKELTDDFGVFFGRITALVLVGNKLTVVSTTEAGPRENVIVLNRTA